MCHGVRPDGQQLVDERFDRLERMVDKHSRILEGGNGGTWRGLVKEYEGMRESIKELKNLVETLKEEKADREKAVEKAEQKASDLRRDFRTAAFGFGSALLLFGLTQVVQWL